ncbi:MAG TPA: AMP-binding protein [Acidimicrobiales bacterium]|nr:AMP-binding protein [Acidimicrobiales bacterium]
MNLAMLLDIPASIVPEQEVFLGRQPRTYGQLRHAAGRVAATLADHGVGRGDRVGVFSTNQAAYAEVLFGAAVLGAVAVPMNCRAGGEELAHLLGDSQARIVFTEGRYSDLVRAQAGGVPVTVFGPDYQAELERRDPVVEAADVDDDDVAVVLYTSGTTSLPKGVMLTHGALTGYVMNRSECADGTDRGRTIVAAPLHHVAAISSLLSAVYGGRPAVLLAQFDAGEWLDAVERHRVTHGFLVPTMLARLLAHPDVAKRDLSSLELVTYGAAPMPPSLILRALQTFPSTVSFSGAYGQTETTATVAVLSPDDHRLSGGPEEVEAKTRRLSSVGRPVDDVELRVVGDDGNDLPAGQTGEVLIRTARTMAGYWGAPSAEARGTVDDAGWLHTGDLGHLEEDGYLFLGGRAGGLIIRGGENVSPEDVEAALFEHPDVADVGVVGVPDEEWGERVGAAVVARPGSGLTAEDVLAFCARRLPGYKRPERVIIMDALPRTSTGKLVRRNLLPVFTGGD